MEKLNKKFIMVSTDVLRGCFVGIFALLYVLGILKPWMIAVLTLCISTAEAFRMPSGTAFIRQIIDMKYYTYANSLNNTLCTITELVGMDAITFFASALIISLIRCNACHFLYHKHDSSLYRYKGYLPSKQYTLRLLIRIYGNYEDTTRIRVYKLNIRLQSWLINYASFSLIINIR